MQNKKNLSFSNIFSKLNHIALRSEKFFYKHLKFISLGFSVIFLFVVGYFFYKQFIIEPKDKEAADLFIDAQMFYDQGKIKEALGGDDSGLSGFSDIFKEYSQTASGKISALYAGSIEFNQSNYQKALEYFKGFESKDKDLEALKYGCLGDTYLELKNSNMAITSYERAIKLTNNSFLFYRFSKKLAQLLVSNSKTKEAFHVMQRVLEKYPDFNTIDELESYVEELKYSSKS